MSHEQLVTATGYQSRRTALSAARRHACHAYGMVELVALYRAIDRRYLAVVVIRDDLVFMAPRLRERGVVPLTRGQLVEASASGDYEVSRHETT